ncbi:oxidoreductase [Hahella sp. CCB-MM4]|uniref:oxidoreductase n=1 Tax=Hahella sp. (strain CCB-MM4) TaxID=1926491 RepID=UPI000B9C0B7E|nr:oxidoreductase [Hahella sp. CCB-MM4]OZG71926.1 oxidoreductase [Hahella sp. CCB-MM4]
MVIKVGLIGLGLSGKTFHFPFYKVLPEYQLSAVLSRQTDVVAEIAPEAICVQSLDQLLVADVDLVVITAPNTEHFPYAKAALEAGKHVVLEKPFVNSVAEGQELIQLAEKKQRILSVYHNRRWDGDFLTIKKMLSENKLGSISHYESHFDRFRPEPRERWRETPLPGSGILYDLGSHLIDQALVLFGVPATISATVKAMRENSEVDDYIHLLLEYPSRQVILHASMLTPLPGPRFCIHGSLGTFIKSGLDPQEDRLKDGVLPDHPDWAQEQAASFGHITHADGSSVVVPTEVGGYQHYYQALGNAIKHGAANPVPPEQALRVIQLIELAGQSYNTGQRLAVPEL